MARVTDLPQRPGRRHAVPGALTCQRPKPRPGRGLLHTPRDLEGRTTLRRDSAVRPASPRRFTLPIWAPLGNCHVKEVVVEGRTGWDSHRTSKVVESAAGRGGGLKIKKYRRGDSPGVIVSPTPARR